MRLDGYLSSHIVQPCINSGLFMPEPGIPILMYHSISEETESDRGDYYKVCTPPELFRAHLRLLKEEGFTVLDLAAAVDALEGSGDGSGMVEGGARRVAVITFDDGFRNFLTDAWPALSDCGFAATVFLPTQFIGNQRATFQERDCLTWNEVRMLRGEGVGFGSHSVSHARLEHLDESGLLEELLESRQVIEKELGEPIDFFSHPYAFPQANPGYVEGYRRGILGAGYRAAVTTRLGRARYGDDLSMLKRLPVNGADGPELFRAKLMGAYDWLHAPQQAMQWIKRSRHFAAR